MILKHQPMWMTSPKSQVDPSFETQEKQELPEGNMCILEPRAQTLVCVHVSKCVYVSAYILHSRLPSTRSQDVLRPLCMNSCSFSRMPADLVQAVEMQQ